MRDRCCRDENGRIGAAIAAAALKSARCKEGGPPVEKERAKLLEECVRATGSQDAGALLARIHEIDVDVDLARLTRDKIAPAAKRREALRRLVETVGG